MYAFQVVTLVLVAMSPAEIVQRDVGREAIELSYAVLSAPATRRSTTSVPCEAAERHGGREDRRR